MFGTFLRTPRHSSWFWAMTKRQERPVGYASIEELVADSTCLRVCVFGNLSGVKQNAFKNALLQQNPEFAFQEVKKVPHLKFGHIYFAVSSHIHRTRAKPHVTLCNRTKTKKPKAFHS
jgi:hypothetical protein